MQRQCWRSTFEDVSRQRQVSLNMPTYNPKERSRSFASIHVVEIPQSMPVLSERSDDGKRMSCISRRSEKREDIRMMDLQMRNDLSTDELQHEFPTR